jgi:hypothetical protein
MIEPATILCSLYRIDQVLSYDERRASYLGTVLGTEQPFVAVELDQLEAAATSPLKTVSHPHLAKVLDIIELGAGRALLMAERVEGEGLEAELAKNHGPHAPVHAVRLMLRIADALAAVHGAGAAHGALRPDCVVARPEGRLGPVLGYTCTSADPSPYLSPDRRAGGPPSAQDDTWGLTALLYRTLTGEDPPVEGFGDAAAVSARGVLDEPLIGIVLRGLHASPAERSTSLKHMRRDLARWFVEHAGDEALPSPPDSMPPPLPAPVDLVSVTSAAATPVNIKHKSWPARAARRRRTALLVAVGLVLGLGAGFVANRNRAHLDPPIASPAVAPSAPTAQPMELAEVPVTAQQMLSAGNERAACVAAHLPEGAFGVTPDLSWLCGEADPRSGSAKLHAALIEAAPKAARPTHAMKLFGKMGWYRLPAYAVVRAGCCAGAAPLSLPEPHPDCPNLAKVLDEIGRRVAASESLDEALASFRKGVYCELNHGRGKTYRQTEPPAGGQDTAFLELLQKLERP